MADSPARHPLPVPLESPDGVANLLIFLASDQATYTAGALVDVSGGTLATQIQAKACGR